MRVRSGLLAAAVALGLTGCANSVQVDAYPTTPGSDVDCAAMLADVPPTVAGQPLRRVADGVAAAWGDPLIVLRCGVEEPEALTPSSQCADVAGVGWFSETTADGLLFTTIGRRFFVSVEVPSVHDPAADALVDLAATIERHDPLEQPCV